MKNLINRFIVMMLCVATSGFSFSQTVEDLQKTLSSQQDNAIKQLDAIINGVSKTKEGHTKYAKEAAKYIEEAEHTQEKLKAAIPPKRQGIAKIHLEEMKIHNENAEKRVDALLEELYKPKMDEEKIKAQAQKVKDSVEEAKMDLKLLKENMK